ncbi:MAG: hypothetical protein JW774_13355 [Candidatus Aureabacteria bacterium]|nr:hypothetical protein [Candidatus Auribacterota bacterium]
MKELIEKLSQFVHKMSVEVGKMESKVTRAFDKKAPKSLKSFVKDPGVLFENYDKRIPVSKIEEFLKTKGKEVAFSEMLDQIIKLKLSNIFKAKKSSSSANKQTKKGPRRKHS